mmetsp:Transcript_8775/g.26438  ORF Transcript_8775/g.26438 Transcript_8775/m.26438 type:complete len:201 (-) Transcript_8775:70-672(-)
MCALPQELARKLDVRPQGCTTCVCRAGPRRFREKISGTRSPPTPPRRPSPAGGCGSIPATAIDASCRRVGGTEREDRVREKSCLLDAALGLLRGEIDRVGIRGGQHRCALLNLLGSRYKRHLDIDIVLGARLKVGHVAVLSTPRLGGVVRDCPLRRRTIHLVPEKYKRELGRIPHVGVVCELFLPHPEVLERRLVGDIIA